MQDSRCAKKKEMGDFFLFLIGKYDFFPNGIRIIFMEQLLRKERSDMADRIENEEIIIS